MQSDPDDFIDDTVEQSGSESKDEDEEVQPEETQPDESGDKAQPEASDDKAKPKASEDKAQPDDKTQSDKEQPSESDDQVKAGGSGDKGQPDEVKPGGSGTQKKRNSRKPTEHDAKDGNTYVIVICINLKKKMPNLTQKSFILMLANATFLCLYGTII